MGKKARVRYLCTYCESKISEGTSFCGSCAHPTSWATHDQKVAWELSQYEGTRRLVTEEIAQVQLPVIPRTYTRRAAEAPRNTRTVERPVRPTASRPAASRSARVAPPVRLPVAKSVEVELPDVEDQALLFKIVRILNQRITELEARVEQMEGENSQAVTG